MVSHGLRVPRRPGMAPGQVGREEHCRSRREGQDSGWDRRGRPGKMHQVWQLGLPGVILCVRWQ